MDDVTVNAEGLRSQIANLEKKQRKFDGQLSEQQSLAEKNAQDRDQAEMRARQAETKALSLTRELENYQDKLEEVERLRKQLAVSLKSDHRVIIASTDLLHACVFSIVHIHNYTHATLYLHDSCNSILYKCLCVLFNVWLDVTVGARLAGGEQG